MTPALVSPEVIQLRLISDLMTAFNFGVLAVALFVFSNRNDIGHKTLIRLCIIFFTMISGDSCFAAWNIYHRHVEVIAMMRLGTAMFGTACVTYFMVIERDIIRTLRISELWDRLRKEKAADGEQARINMSYASRQTLHRSEAMVMGRTRL